MPRRQGRAFVLRRWDVGESDQLVSLLLENRGKLRGIAKGAKRSRKRFGGLLSPFLLVQVEYFERANRELVRIEGCTLIEYYASIHRSLEKLLAGCCALEFLERVLPERSTREEEDWFGWFRSCLECLDRRDAPGPWLWVFLAKGLAHLGLKPEFTRCIHCRRPLGRTGIFGFSVPLGGAVCGGCLGMGTVTHRVSSEALFLLDGWISLPIDKATGLAGVGEQGVREGGRILEAFLDYHVGKHFRSLRVMGEVLARIGGRERPRPKGREGPCSFRT